MALVIQTNTAAITAQKNINTNTMGQNKALNRLSSGFRINSAADDAAGFAISSKLDAQGSRLKAAVQNASQASALVKTAEAGANEIQNMIVRLQALAIQAASANNASELTQLDAERTKLTSEIDKIANSTNFNGTNLLNGKDASATGNVAAVLATGGTVTAGGGITNAAPTSTGLYGANTFQITTTAGAAASAGTSGSTYAGGPTGISAVAVASGGLTNSLVNGLYTVVAASATTADVYKGDVATGVKVGSALATGTAGTFTLANGVQITTTGNQTATGTSGTFTISGATVASAGTVTSVKATADLLDTSGNVTQAAGTELLSATQNRSLTSAALILTLKNGATLSVTDTTTVGSQVNGLATANITGGTNAVVADYASSLIFQVGGENNANDQVTVNLQNKYTTAGLALTGDISSASNAQTYIDTLKTSLDTLISQRADLGASANQLSFVAANLATSIEQISASVSSIRDADIATEIANFTKSQILVQAGTAMLAQANQASKNVLRLFLSPVLGERAWLIH